MSKIPYGIRSLKIENFRGIDHLELDFTDPQGNPNDIVVIAGPNGCGKTAVLEAAYSLLQGNLPVLAESDANAQTKRLDATNIRKGSDSFDLSLMLTTPVGDVEIEHTSNSPFHPKSNSDTRIPTIFISSRRTQNLVGALSVSLGNHTAKPRPTVLNCAENERLGTLKQELLDSRTFELFGGKPPPNSVTYEQLMTPLRNMWKRFYPHRDETFEVEPVGDTPINGFDLFLTNHNDLKVSVDSLSSGQLELVTMFGTFSRLKNVPSIVLIDEPELHLDPLWHASLISELKRLLPMTQMIVTTHSPQIYDSVQSYKRHFLVPSDDPRAKRWNTTLLEEVAAS